MFPSDANYSAHMKTIAILGSTGSIGRQTLDVVESQPERFRVVALAAGKNLEELTAQIARHRPQLVSVADAARADELARSFAGRRARAAAGDSVGQGRTAERGDASGCARSWFPRRSAWSGLAATYAAVRAGKQVALSNKEVLVAAGELVMAAAKASGRRAAAGG